jgi:hypothetical protein
MLNHPTKEVLMLRSSLSKVLATCVVALALSAAAFAAVLHPGCGTPRIDGSIAPFEWSNAAQVPLNVNVPGGTTPGTLYVMNDRLNLYVAVSYKAPALYDGDGLSFDFDNDNDGAWPEEGDDVIVQSTALVNYYDGFRNTLPPCVSAVPDCVSRDTTHGGVNNGVGSMGNNGIDTVIEMAHELNSRDFGKDFALVPGSLVGFHAAIFIDSAGVTYATHMPVGAFALDQIEIAACPKPVLSACGTPVIDGVVNLGEWAGTGTWDVAVRTPRGGTSPASFYVMNDALNLYVGFRFERPAADVGNSLAVEFDNDNDGIAENGDDVILVNGGSGFYDDVRTNLPPCPPGSAPASCGPEDTDLGGTEDGVGFFSNNGIHSMYEMSHPLNSGDINDFALSAFSGDIVGFFLALRAIAAPGAYPADFADTDLPGVRDYAQIKLCTPSASASIATLSAAVSGLDPRLGKALQSAQENLAAGKVKQAVNDLEKFIKEVEKLIARGEIAPSVGEPLIATAQAILQTL